MNKRHTNRLKTSIIICSLVIPTAMLFGFLINTTQAGYNIPEDPSDNNNAWTWEVNLGTELAYEVEIIITEIESGDIYWQVRYLDILKISNIDNGTYEFMGQMESVSYIEAKHYYYDCELKSIAEIEDQSTNNISIFGFDSDDAIPEKLSSEVQFYPPLVLPLNNSDICDQMADIYYESTLRWIANKYTNDFDQRGVVPVDGSRDKMWFLNSSDGYFINSTYINTDGTLESAVGYFLMYGGDGDGGPGGWLTINLTMTRVYGPDYCAAITDEVSWDFNSGTEFYFGMNNEEYMAIITDFWNISIESYVMDWEIPQPYEVVNASIYKWNDITEEYDEYLGENIIAAANNHYPFPLIALFEGESPIMAIPKGTNAKDMAFLLNNFTMEEWPLKAYITDNGKTFQLTFEEDGGTMLYKFDDGGVFKIGYMEFGGWLEGVMFRKNITKLVDGADWEQLGWDFVGNNQVLVNFTATDDLELYSAVLPVNPLEPLIREDDIYSGCYFEHEIPGLPLYIDLYTNNTGAIGTPIKMNITYDEGPLYDSEILESELKVYKFNASGNNKWDEAPAAYFTIDENINTINITAPGFSYYTIGAEVSWNWSQELYDAVDDDGFVMIYESLGNMSGKPDPSMGEITIPFVNHAILNITDIRVENKLWAPGQGMDNFSQIIASLLYYEPKVEDLVQDVDAGPFVLAEYCYNESRDLPLLYNLSIYSLLIPLIIPLRFDKVFLKTIGFSINETFYSSNFSREAGFPIWDEIYSNPITNTLIFNETTSDYFMKFTYYDNGTLKEAEFFFKSEWEEEIDGEIETQLIELELRGSRQFDYNTTDEVEWGIDVGDVIYYGSNFPEGGMTMEINITITKFNQTAINLLNLLDFGDDGDDMGPLMFFYSWVTFENVWADVWYWNITENSGPIFFNGSWEYLGESLIAAACNYYPFPIGNYYDALDLEGFMVPILLPKDTTGYELAETYGDFFTLMFMMETEGEIRASPPDVGKDYLRLDFYAPDYPEYDFYIEWYLDVDTGVSRLWYVYEEYEGESYISATFRKNHTSVGGGYQVNYFECDNYLVDPINVTLRINSLGAYDVFEALLNRNPVNGSIPWNVIFYMDFFLINDSSEAYNFTFSIELPSNYKVKNINYLAIYEYDPADPSGVGTWTKQSLADVPGKFIKYTNNNSIRLSIEDIPGGFLMILAFLYSRPPGAAPPAGDDDDGKEEELPEAIPGYYIHILLLVLSLISIVLIIKRRKIIDLI